MREYRLIWPVRLVVAKLSVKGTMAVMEAEEGEAAGARVEERDSESFLSSFCLKAKGAASEAARSEATS